MNALSAYRYSVNLFDYEHADQYSPYFTKGILGDRDSTIEFEDYFRKNASTTIEVYFEVIFWKLYNFGQKGQARTTDLISKIKTKPETLCSALRSFVTDPTTGNLKNLRELLGMKRDNGTLAVPLTFPAFINPEEYPMVDSRVAKWINRHHRTHSTNTKTQLTRFVSWENGFKTLSDIDFDNYLNWVHWCREVADTLTSNTNTKWRARDVEMAIFTASKSKECIMLEIP